MSARPAWHERKNTAAAAGWVLHAWSRTYESSVVVVVEFAAAGDVVCGEAVGMTRSGY